MDVLAAISGDPLLLPLWAVFVFAVGMYPVGMLFGCRECCTVCKSCCRDKVGQVVIDFSLDGTGPQLVKDTPFAAAVSTFDSGGIGSDPVDYQPIAGVPTGGQNFAGNQPVFLATGQTSGARWMFPARLNSDGTVSPWFARAYALPMGSTERAEFVNGEAVTITPYPSASVVQQPSVSAVVEDCPLNITPSYIQADFVGTPGKWQPSPITQAGLYVDCQADEGTVIFDVESHDGRQPEYCDDCTPSVGRWMSHPTSFSLSPCHSTGAVQLYNAYAEKSTVEVAVNLMSSGPPGSVTCPASITATATRSWRGFSASCQKITTHKIDSGDQDCSPFNLWPSQTKTTGPGSFVEQLVTLTATSCFGSGFFGKATQPSGLPETDAGPLAALEVTDPGSGYAVKGRVQPDAESVQISSSSGSGADLTLTWTETADDCGRPVWNVSAVTLASDPGAGGTNYTDGEQLSVTAIPPAIQTNGSPAVLIAHTGRQEPSLVFGATGGSGAAVSISIEPNATTPPTWSVSDVTLTAGGTGYTYGQPFYIDGETAKDVAADWSYGYGEVQTAISEPTLELFGGTGTSAAFTVAIASNGGTPETWGISSVTINEGGAGYEIGDMLSVNTAAGDSEVSPAVVAVSDVDGSGAILDVEIYSGGAYNHDNGEIVGLDLWYGGEYYRDSGVIQSVTVEDGGSYYQESDTEPAIVAEVTISISQSPPSNGSGAFITATVDDDPASETFGQIAGLTIDDGGDDYLAVLFGPGVCTGPGGIYDAFFGACGGVVSRGVYQGPVLFTRACPDYEYDITIQPAEA